MSLDDAYVYFEGNAINIDEATPQTLGMVSDDAVFLARRSPIRMDDECGKDLVANCTYCLTPAAKILLRPICDKCGYV